MYTLAVSIHLIVCFLMIAAILLQAGKGAEIGASFGGSSQTVFGSRGPGTFLSKVTVGAAIVFMLSSLSLAMLSKQANTSSTVIDLHPQTHHESSSSATEETTTGASPTKTETSSAAPPETSSEPASDAKSSGPSEP
ncbi:MAG: preprotein translocase subunit SecG [Nitrospirota bacterium]|nr:MAG: preprotein translocase subunit SecG [Nitrospirota bacterium]